MIGPEHLEPDCLESVQKLRPTYPCFLTHIGVKGVSTDVLRDAQGYYWNSWNPDEAGRGSLKFKIFVPTLYEPALSPPGGHVVIIQKILEFDYTAVQDWAAHKAAVEDYIMTNLEQVIPGFSEKIVVKLSASALTSYRYTLNYQGAMLGWEMSPDQLGTERPGIFGPAKNLYCVGHWVRPGGGITPVIISAVQVAKAITQSIEPAYVAPAEVWTSPVAPIGEVARVGVSVQTGD
jgi:phytoene dehydrogenase-like protein